MLYEVITLSLADYLVKKSVWIHGGDGCRITSYNVCYTKLLRVEGIAMSDKALGLVARQGEGSMRDSLSALDQIIAFCA